MRRVAASLEDARRELIDISRRNRLLHTPRAVIAAQTPRVTKNNRGDKDGRTVWNSSAPILIPSSPASDTERRSGLIR
jgi:hypothetical protein